MKFLLQFLTCLMLISFSSCKLEWSTALRYGKVDRKIFSETVNIDIDNGLIFLPIEINEKTYRFLLDTGAPCSISNDLQDILKYKIISSSSIVDSDKNSKKVNYVQVDTMYLGDIPFINQTAFVGDFKANPILECLDIDGIVGSNFMRHANWIIDQSQKSITICNSIPQEDLKESAVVPFQTDQQFNIKVDVGFNDAKVNNLKVDYGSNGALSLPKHIFQTLQDKKIITKTYHEVGTKQSGIVGNPVVLDRLISFIESVKFDNMVITNISVKTNRSALIGNQVLSKFKVFIDWDLKNLYFDNPIDTLIDHNTLGFKLSCEDDGNIFIQSIIEHSEAFKKGLTPGMKVLKYDTLDFTANDDYCDYLEIVRSQDSTSIEIIDPQGISRNLQIQRASYSDIEIN